MNTTKFTLVLTVAAALSIICPVAFGNSPKNEAAACVTFEERFLDISGVMTIGDEKVSNYTVFIFQDGSPSDTFQVNNRLEQHFMLPLGHNYALKFSRPGCKDRIMLINAFVDEKNVHEFYTFRYDVQFIPNEVSNTEDDMPVAFVHYDKEKKDFDYNRQYHKNVRTDLTPAETNTAGDNKQSGSWH